MFYSQDEFAFITDGNFRLLVFPKPFEKAPFVGLFISNIDSSRVTYGFDMDHFLSNSFDIPIDDEGAWNIELEETFPGVNLFRQWVPVTGSGWHKSIEGRYFIRVSSKVTHVLGDAYQNWFIIYDAIDGSLKHWPFTELSFKYPIPKKELIPLLIKASEDFPAMNAKLSEIEKSL